MSQTYQVFTHKDLDGAVSLLTFLWSKPNCTILFNEVNNLEINKIKENLKKTINPKNVYIFDLSLREEFLPELDESFITIIDHHQKSENFLNRFKNAKILHKEYSSNCLLIKKIVTDQENVTLTDKQKKLIVFADDFDSGAYKFKESYDLNILFWTFYKNNFAGFIKDFRDGYISPTPEQQQKINYEKTNIEKIASGLQKFKGNINIKGQTKEVLGVQYENFNYLLVDNITRSIKSDLYFYIDVKNNKVILRQTKSEDSIDLDVFTQKFCEGSGNRYSAVGKITPLFMELTKNLKPL